MGVPALALAKALRACSGVIRQELELQPAIQPPCTKREGVIELYILDNLIIILCVHMSYLNVLCKFC